jgi:hypothetical protein
MKGWFTLSHQPVQGEVCNNGKITVKCTEAEAIVRYGGYVLLFREMQISQLEALK